MYFYPAGGAGDILSMVLGTPAFHKAHAYGAHFCELVHCLKPMVYRLAEKLCKLLVVKDLEAATGWNLTHGGGMEVVVIVTLAALYKDAAVTETLGKHLPSHIVQVDT